MKRQDKKALKEVERRYGKLAASIEPYYERLNLIPLEELDDLGFAFIIANLKGVEMLDLNETFITDESISRLPHLEYVNELRIKGCSGVTDKCIPHLAAIKELRFIHAKNTAITIDGLLQLPPNEKLTTLLFSSHEKEMDPAKIQALKNRLPNCSLVIDSKDV